MNKYILTALNIATKPLTVNTFPLHFQLEPTTYCNLHCKMCSRQRKIERGIVPHLKHMKFAAFKKVIDTIRPYKGQISGQGEPLMNPELPEILTYAVEKGVKISTITNFILMNQELARKIVQSGLNLLKISLDAGTNQTYKEIRGLDKFEEILTKIREFTALRETLGSRTPFLRIQFCVQQDNYHEIASLIPLAKKAGIDAIYYQPLELTDFEDHTEELVGSMGKSQLWEELKKGQAAAKTFDLAANLDDWLRNFEVFWKKYEWSQDPKKKPAKISNTICLLPWFSVYVTVDGDVKPCCSLSRDRIVMGNLFQQPFQEIWNGKKYQNFRKAIHSGIMPNDVCKNCVPRSLSDIINLRRILPGIMK